MQENEELRIKNLKQDNQLNEMKMIQDKLQQAENKMLTLVSDKERIYRDFTAKSKECDDQRQKLSKMESQV